MKITFKTLAIATSLCSALVFAPMSFAQSDGFDNPSEYSQKQGKSSEKRLAKLTKKLNLTEEQQAQVRVLQAEHMAEKEALKPAFEAFRTQKKALMNAETLDEAAFTALLESNQGLFVSKALMRAQHAFAMKSILTEEQLEKFMKMKKKKSRKSRR